MRNRISQQDRMALIGAMSQKAPKGSLNRTALMKCTYFLQTLRRVPLGYDFTLYSYGPYDSHVLDDLEYAEMLGVVSATRVEYTGGYGYKIEPTHRAGLTSEFIVRYRDDIDWVLKEFGDLGSAELELVSTLIYADRESPKKSQTIRDLVRRVRDVKPRFSENHIHNQGQRLAEKNLLQSIKAP